MLVSEVQITPVKPRDGLVAFASCVVDNYLYLGSLGVHKRLDGSGYRITYPAKRIGSQQLHYFHPIRKALSDEIEQAVTRQCVQIFEKSDEQDDRHDKATHQST